MAVGREALNMMASIIINNYNYARFLRAAIDSALGQSHQPIEVLVVDDGSTDQSRAIIDSYGDRIKPVLKKNGGQASALNAGFGQCQGDSVIFLDADDVLLPHAAKRVAEVFSAQPQTAKIQYRMEVIDQGGLHTGVIKPPVHIPLPTGDLTQQELSFPFDLTWLPTSGNAFAARALRSILPIPETVYGKVGADWYVAHLTPLFGAVVSLDEVCADYRVHANNNYELAEPRLDLTHIRQTIVYCDYTRDYLLKIIGAFVITGAGGVLLEKLHFKLPDNPLPVGLALLIGGGLFLAVERWLRGRELTDQVTWRVALLVGVAQLIAAIFPGTSRSGATILFALALGLSRPAATEFSFLVGIPTMLAAGGLKIFKALHHPGAGPAENWSQVIVASLVAAVVSFVVVKWLLRYVRTHTFTAFGWYRIAAGVLTLVLLARH